MYVKSIDILMDLDRDPNMRSEMDICTNKCDIASHLTNIENISNPICQTTILDGLGSVNSSIVNEKRHDLMSMSRSEPHFNGDNSWTKDYYSNIAHIVDHEELQHWNQLEHLKLWKQYKASGYGYEGFAKDFYKYKFCTKVSNNPNLCIQDLVNIISTNDSIEQALIDVESSLMNSNTLFTKDQLWIILAELNSISGQSTQTISAFNQLKLDIFSYSKPFFYQVHSLPLILASAYINENCIPEALDVLKILQNTKYPIINTEMITIPLLISDYKNAICQHPDVELQLGLSIIYFLSEQYKLALDSLEFILNTDQTLNPFDKSCILNKIGAAYYKMSNHQQAIKYYTKAIDTCSNDIKSYVNMAICYLEQNEFEASQDVCERALKRFRNDDISKILSIINNSLFKT